MVLCARDMIGRCEYQSELFFPVMSRNARIRLVRYHDGCWLYHSIPWIEGQDGTEQDNVTDFPFTVDIKRPPLPAACLNAPECCPGLRQTQRRGLWLTPIMSANGG